MRRLRRLGPGRAPLAAGMVGLLAAPGPVQEARTGVTGPERVVQEQVNAYNRHDIDAFLNTYSPDTKLYAFPDKELSTGLESMRTSYGKLFAAQPDLKVRIAKRIVQGDCVIDQEQVSGGGPEFTAVAIYRVKGDKITAVWFQR